MVYHATERTQWEDAKEKGLYEADGFQDDGFIHFSRVDQVIQVANFLYKGEKDMVLLCVDENDTSGEMVFEDLKGHGTFPHFYGALRVEEVKNVVDFPCNDSGSFDLPEELK